MTFLELVTEAWNLVGLQGSGPTTVVGQTGNNKRAVDAVIRAWLRLQMARGDWRFMRSTASRNTVAGTQDYAANTFTTAITGSIARWLPDRECRLYLASKGNADSQRIRYEPIEAYERRGLDRGTIPSGRPSLFTLLTDDTVRLWANPDAIYTVVIPCMLEPETMDPEADGANTLMPARIPARHHWMIVYDAAINLGKHFGAGDKIMTILPERKEAWRHLLDDQLEPASILPEPLDR